MKLVKEFEKQYKKVRKLEKLEKKTKPRLIIYIVLTSSLLD